ncbi:MAG: HEAT repeat domain-containing protein, partial [Planctomycetota bacterium]
MDPDRLIDERFRRRDVGRQLLLWALSLAVHLAIILLAAQTLVSFFTSRQAPATIHATFRAPIELPGPPSAHPGIGPAPTPGIETTKDDRTIEAERPENKELAAAGLKELPFIPVLAPGRLSSGGSSIFDMRTEGGKREALIRGGGTGGTQRAVDLALEWLARHQDADGKWSPDLFPLHDPPNDRCTGPGMPEHVIGISSLSMLCFLAAGYVPAQGKYADVVSRGLDYLSSRQVDTGEFPRPMTTNMYDQALATLVMIEISALTGDRLVYERARTGVRVILDAQQPEGGWDYGPYVTHRNDASIAGWQVITLKGAEGIGIDVPWKVKYRLARFLDSVSSPRSLVHYASGAGADPSHRELSSQAVTASVLLGRVLLGQARRGEILRLAGLVSEELPDWNDMVEQGTDLRARQNFYTWYYGTMSLFQLGGSAWDAWNARMRKELIDHQRMEGSARGSWDPVSCLAATYGGRVYSTALACLCLEVYYRYLRIYDLEGSEAFAEVLRRALDAAEDDEARIDMIARLAEYPGPVAADALRKALLADNPEVRFRAAKLLSDFHEDFDPAAILVLLRAPDSRVREKALALLEEIATPRLDPAPFVALLRDNPSYVRSRAVRILQRIGTRSVVEPLIDALADTEPSVAGDAYTALCAVTGMAINFSPEDPPEKRSQAIDEWRAFWASEKDSPDFGSLRRIVARITDVHTETNRVLISAGTRHRVAEGQVWSVSKIVT